MADPTDLNARWTDEQETALFKAIIRFKPVGMHKHFRMLAIRQSLLAQGVIDSHDSDQQTAANVLPDELGADNAATGADEHTSIPGIWAKLNSMYDLAGLDEREDAILYDGGNGDDDTEEKADVEYYRNFDLPDDEFGLMKDERRLNPDGSRSPSGDLREEGLLPEAPRSASMRNRTRGTDEDARSSSPAVSASARGGSTRGGGRSRGRGARGGRVSRLRDEAEESGSRRTSRASNTPADDETVEEPDEDEGSGAGDDDDETDEQSATESSVDQEEKRKVAPRRRGRRGGARGQQSRLSSGNARGSTKRARRK